MTTALSSTGIVPSRTPLDAALADRSLFTPWTHPHSGVVSYLLTRPTAPFLQSFYFVNSSFDAAGRWCWFYHAAPPSSRVLGVIDFVTGQVRLFPETEFLDASPTIDPATGAALWFQMGCLWRRGPYASDPLVCVHRIPEDLIKNRKPKRLATHLTPCADGQSVNFDAEIGSEWLAGDIPLAGGDIRTWRRFSQCYNHAQFSPTDPDLQLIAQDGWDDAATGAHHDYTHRMWLLRRSGELEPIFPYPTPKHGHEWWDPDGHHVWYIHYGIGVERVNIHTRQHAVLWAKPLSHAYATRAGRYLVGDVDCSGRTPRCQVEFHDTRTGRTVPIVDIPWKLGDMLWRYHVHPHPRFVLDDRYICYTTQVRGRVDLALVRTADLVDATA